MSEQGIDYFLFGDEMGCTFYASVSGAFFVAQKLYFISEREDINMKKTYAKQILILLLSVLLLATLAVSVSAAGEVTIVDSGTCGDNSTWTLDSAGTLTISGEGKLSADYSNTDYYFLDESIQNLIKNIVIEEGITEIYGLMFQFYKTVVDNLYIPASVISINGGNGDVPFHNICSFTVSMGNPAFSSMDGCLYSKDLATLYCYANAVKETFITPDSVKTIEYSAFCNYRPNLKHIIYTKNVERIEGNTFPVPLESVTVLNPNCYIGYNHCLGENTNSSDSSEIHYVYGYEDSTAQKYVETYNNTSWHRDRLVFIPLCPTQHANKVEYPEQPATCVGKGYTAGTYCPDCEEWLEGHEEIGGIDPNNHVNQKAYEAVAFTCTTNGYTAGIKCEDCGKWLSGHKVIPAHHVDENVDGICDVCTLRFAYILKLNEPLTLDYTNSSEEKVLFTPTETGFYRLTSEEVMQDGYAEIEDKDGREPNSIYANDEKLTVNALLQAGETYTISIHSYQKIDSLTVIMTKQEAPAGSCGENVHWILDETGTLTISGTGAIEDYDIVFGGTVIPPWMDYVDYIESVVVNNGVTRIGDFAFYGMQKQCASVTLPETLESIGTGAFVAWGQLQEVTIPASVTSIGAAAFAETPLQKITLLNPSCEILEIFTYTDSETGETEEEDLGAWTLGFEETTVYGYPNSTAEAYAQKYERTFIALEPPAAEPMTETDTATGIAVTYDSDAYTGEITLSVNKVENGGNYLVKTYEKTTAWDITTLLNGVETQLVEPVTVSIPVPDGYNENALAIYHVNDKGEAEKVEPITVKDGIITFTATSFSIYIVVDESSEVKPHTHTYTATVTTKPACTKPGETTYTCTCGDTYTETIPATGNHVDDNNDGKCDTCGEKMTGGKHCKYCGKIHNGNFFDKLTGFFHKILAIFKR